MPAAKGSARTPLGPILIEGPMASTVYFYFFVLFMPLRWYHKVDDYPKCASLYPIHQRTTISPNSLRYELQHARLIAAYRYKQQQPIP